MGSFADMMGWKNESSQSIVDGAFANTDTLMIAIFDAEELDNNWGKGKMSDYVIQKYWLAKDDVIESDNKTLKRISFPPNEGMKSVRMDPAYGTYNAKRQGLLQNTFRQIGHRASPIKDYAEKTKG